MVSHILNTANSMSKKLDILFRCVIYLTIFQLLHLDKRLIQQCSGYCCHIWNYSCFAVKLDAVQRMAVHLISGPELTTNFESGCLMQICFSVSLFFIAVILFTDITVFLLTVHEKQCLFMGIVSLLTSLI